MKNGIIAFCGSKGAGKSTSYDIFKQFYNGPLEECAFAEQLKKVCSKVFDIDMKYFTDPKLKEVELEQYIYVEASDVLDIFKGFELKDGDDFVFDQHVRPHIGFVSETPRKLLQYVGTEVLHPIDPLIHAKFVLNKKDPNKLTVVTDLRFMNEFNYLKEIFGNDFVPVYIKNPRAEVAAETDLHPSERELQLFKNKCFQLDNHGSLSELKRRIIMMTSEVFKEDLNVSI